MDLTELRNTILLPKVKKKDVVTFTRELATLNKAGVPLIKCLLSLKEQMPIGRFRLALTDIIEDIERGDTFSEALAHHPKIFPALYVNMIRSGELGGNLTRC